jgi:hypothetical protein
MQMLGQVASASHAAVGAGGAGPHILVPAPRQEETEDDFADPDTLIDPCAICKVRENDAKSLSGEMCGMCAVLPPQPSLALPHPLLRPWLPNCLVHSLTGITMGCYSANPLTMGCYSADPLTMDLSPPTMPSFAPHAEGTACGNVFCGVCWTELWGEGTRHLIANPSKCPVCREKVGVNGVEKVRRLKALIEDRTPGPHTVHAENNLAVRCSSLSISQRPQQPLYGVSRQRFTLEDAIEF